MVETTVVVRKFRRLQPCGASIFGMSWPGLGWHRQRSNCGQRFDLCAAPRIKSPFNAVSWMLDRLKLRRERPGAAFRSAS